MADTLRPGTMKPRLAEDWAGWEGSMAQRIEAELNKLLKLDDLPLLPADPDHAEVRDRRRLFVAIARGVALHLSERHGAFEVALPAPAAPVSPIIAVDDPALP